MSRVGLEGSADSIMFEKYLHEKIAEINTGLQIPEDNCLLRNISDKETKCTNRQTSLAKAQIVTIFALIFLTTLRENNK
jgi:hypothetical protein